MFEYFKNAFDRDSSGVQNSTTQSSQPKSEEKPMEAAQNSLNTGLAHSYPEEEKHTKLPVPLNSTQIANLLSQIQLLMRHSGLLEALE